MLIELGVKCVSVIFCKSTLDGSVNMEVKSQKGYVKK